jgi:hypothetical protein
MINAARDMPVHSVHEPVTILLLHQRMNIAAHCLDGLRIFADLSLEIRESSLLPLLLLLKLFQSVTALRWVEICRTSQASR